MRSLRTIRARVERLAAVGLPGSEPLIVHWVHRHTRCPACGADLEGHAEALALAEARASACPRVLLGGRPDDVPALRRAAAGVGAHRCNCSWHLQGTVRRVGSRVLAYDRPPVRPSRPRL